MRIVHLLKQLSALIILAAAVTSLSGCVRADRIGIAGVSEFDLSDISRPKVVLQVFNDSGSKLRIREGKMSLYYAGSKVLDILLTSEIELPRKWRGEVVMPIRIKVTDPITALVISARDSDIMLSELTVTGSVVAKAGPARKRFDYNRTPLVDFFRSIGFGGRNIMNIEDEN